MKQGIPLPAELWTGVLGRKIRGDAAAQILACYLWSNSHANEIGLYWLPMIYIQAETGLGEAAIERAFELLEENRLVVRDRESEQVLVVRFAECAYSQGLGSKDKRVVRALRVFADIASEAPESMLVKDFLDTYPAARRALHGSSACSCRALGKPSGNSSKDLAEGMGSPSPEALSEGMRNPSEALPEPMSSPCEEHQEPFGRPFDIADSPEDTSCPRARTRVRASRATKNSFLEDGREEVVERGVGREEGEEKEEGSRKTKTGYRRRRSELIAKLRERVDGFESLWKERLDVLPAGRRPNVAGQCRQLGHLLEVFERRGADDVRALLSAAADRRWQGLDIAWLDNQKRRGGAVSVPVADLYDEAA